MSVIGLTLKQIRQAVARNLMGEMYVSSAPTVAGSTTTLIDNLLRNAEIGSWVVGTGGDIDGDISRVETYEKTAHQMTLFPPLSAATATDQTYEMFDSRYPPIVIREAINCAIDYAVGKWYSREESLALHTDGKTYRYDLPSEFDMVDRIQYRQTFTRKDVHSCEAAFDEAVSSSFTVSVDDQRYQRGHHAVKFVTAGDTPNGEFASDSITSVDLSGYDTIELWVRVTDAVASGDLALLLDDTASCASPLETLTIPAIAADTWTRVRLTLANPELDTAIISVALEYNANAGENTIWVDDICGVVSDSAHWVTLPKNLWWIDKEGGDLVFSMSALQSMGHAQLKISGGSNPTRLTADSDVSDLPESYIIAEATALMLMGGSLGRENDQDDRRGLSAFWVGRQSEGMRMFPPLTNARKV